MAHRQLSDAILEFLARRAGESLGPASPAQITAQVQFPRPTVNRHLRELLAAGQIVREGRGPATVYRYRQPLPARTPVSYQRRFVDDYRPNQSSLLPAGLADSLFAEGRMPGQQPAGTYAKKVLEQLLIELSWSSSRLEGN